MEFPQYLAAGSAWPAWGCFKADDGDCGDVAFVGTHGGGDHRGNGIAFCTDGVAVGGVFHIAAGEDLACGGQYGCAMDVWKRMVRAQGGDPEAPMARAEYTHEVVADRDGYLMELDALALGVGSWRLGAGRARKEDPVQLTAGIEIHADLGQKVVKGQKLLTLHTETPDKFDRALESIIPGIVIGDEQPAERQIILERIV